MRRQGANDAAFVNYQKRPFMSEPESIDYFFSLASPWCYLGSRAFQGVALRTEAKVHFKPMDLGKVINAAGGKPLKERPAPLQGYRLVELQRWSQIRNLSLTLWPKYFTSDTSLSHRMVLAAVEDKLNVFSFVNAVSEAKWAKEMDIADPDTLMALANKGGLDGRALLEKAADPHLRIRENELTEEAVSRQVFGAPFFFYRGEPFWGQDRLEQLEDALVIARPALTMRG